MNYIIENKDLKIKSVELGLLSNNVYIIESDNEIAIVDPSCNPQKIIEFNDNKSINKIILTHYHFDHVGAANFLKNKYNCKVYASSIDKFYIENQNKIPEPHRKVDSCEVDCPLSDGDIITIGKTEWQVILTPGHTKGSICLYNDNTNSPVLISGDTLFNRSCGRTDFPDGSSISMAKSMIRLAKLPNNCVVLPGHGPFTTVNNEKQYALSRNFADEYL